MKMSLQDKLDAYKRDFEAKVPQEALKIMHLATENLRNSGIMAKTVKVGNIAPDFSLKDTDENIITLMDLLDKGLVVMGFYRGRW